MIRDLYQYTYDQSMKLASPIPVSEFKEASCYGRNHELKCLSVFHHGFPSQLSGVD